jgi:hypothetical protein
MRKAESRFPHIFDSEAWRDILLTATFCAYARGKISRITSPLEISVSLGEAMAKFGYTALGINGIASAE